MASKDDLGDRIKAYEGLETERLIAPELPLVVRLDGRAFSTFTRGMDKPFDARMSDIMCAVTTHLIEQTQALVGYAQSDEITLILERETPESELIFGGRVFKIVSVLAAVASAKFTLLAAEAWPERVERIIPSFDCRVLNVPSRVEAVNALIWREQDGAMQCSPWRRHTSRPRNCTASPLPSWWRCLPRSALRWRRFRSRTGSGAISQSAGSTRRLQRRRWRASLNGTARKSP